MRVQRAEKNSGVGRRLRQAKIAGMSGVILEPQQKVQLGRDVLAGLQLERETIEKTAENEKQRLEGLNLLLEFHFGREGLPRSDGSFSTSTPA